MRAAISVALFFSLPLSLAVPKLEAQGAVSPQPAPQQNGQPGGTGSVLRNITNLVIVPVTVKDPRGQLVSGLTRDDFRVFEDNVERRIFTFSSDSTALSAVVLLDNDLPDKQAKQVQDSLKTIAAAFGESDEVALVTYDQYPKTVFDFSYDNDKLFTELKRLELGAHSTFVYPDPATAGPINTSPNDPTSAVRVKGPPKYASANFLDDALYYAGQMLKDRGRDRRKIIFLVSDGSDASDNKHPYQETLTTLLQSDVSVYSISVTRSVPLAKSLVQHGASELDKYASKTGGDTFYAAKQQDLDRMYATLTEEARNQYTLTFQPGAINLSEDYHSIEVRVEAHGSNLNILTRDGYYLSALSVGH